MPVTTCLIIVPTALVSSLTSSFRYLSLHFTTRGLAESPTKLPFYTALEKYTKDSTCQQDQDLHMHEEDSAQRIVYRDDVFHGYKQLRRLSK